MWRKYVGIVELDAELRQRHEATSKLIASLITAIEAQAQQRTDTPDSVGSTVWYILQYHVVYVWEFPKNWP